VTLVTSEDIRSYGYRTLADVLQDVPGVYLSNDRNYTYVGVRGFGRLTDYNNRILVQIDGHTVNENVYGSGPVGSDLALNLDSVERIEIVRGPSSALYGTGAVLAVVNVITQGSGAASGTRIGAETGSFGHRRGSLAYGRQWDNGAALTVSGLWRHSDGEDLYFPEFDAPETGHGLATGMDWDRSRGVYARASWTGITLQGLYSRRPKGVPTAAYETVFGDPRQQTLDEFRFVDVRCERDLGGDARWALRGHYDHYRYRGTFPYQQVEEEATDGTWAGGEGQVR
jgi:iron complex outermembrane receptor protein